MFSKISSIYMKQKNFKAFRDLFLLVVTTFFDKIFTKD